MVAITDKVVVVTGGHRGLGAALVDEVLARGARKVYATSRSPYTDDRPEVHSLQLDVQDPDSVTALAQAAPDAQVIFNNAGIFLPQPLCGSDFEHIDETFEVNVYGPLRTARAFAPILAANGGGAIVNMLSVLSWLAGAGAYGASKAAAWSLTNSLRIELRPQHIHVLGVHAGFIDTDMAAGIPMDKLSPSDVARLILDGLEADADEVLTDQMTIDAKAAVSGPVQGLSLTLG